MKQELSTEIHELFNGNMISYDMNLLKKSETLQDYEDFKQGSRLLGFKDIFARISVETWLKTFEPYIDQEVALWVSQKPLSSIRE